MKFYSNPTAVFSLLEQILKTLQVSNFLQLLSISFRPARKLTRTLMHWLSKTVLTFFIACILPKSFIHNKDKCVSLVLWINDIENHVCWMSHTSIFLHDSRATILCRCTAVTANNLVLSCTESSWVQFIRSKVYKVHYLQSFVKHFLPGLKSSFSKNVTTTSARFAKRLLCAIICVSATIQCAPSVPRNTNTTFVTMSVIYHVWFN